MLKIGILGAAGIAPAAIIRPAHRRDDVEIAAVASRSASSAVAYAREHGIARSYGDYRELIADPDIDLIYNALPPSEHAAWTIAALEGGKNVLCEKPFAMNAKQARRMLQAATDTGNRLIEAFHDRYHPLSLELDAIKASRRLGDILSVAANFSSALPFDPKSLRHDPALGGGGLMDLGCYPVHWLRAFTGEEPTITSAEATLNPMGADITIVASMTFPSGATGELITLMEHDTEFVQTLDVVGTEGTMHVDGMIFPSRGHSIQVTIDGLVTESTVGGLSTYDHQLDAIVRGLASGEQLLTEGEDSFATMTVIDAIYAAAGLSRDFD